MIRNRTRMLMPATLLFFLTFTAVGYGQSIKADNSARYVGSGRYDWTVFIVADASTLSKIRSVQYTLHPTFKNPVRKVTKGKGLYPFAVSETGWGEFTIGVKVDFIDYKSTSFNYPLKLYSKTKSK